MGGEARAKANKLERFRQSWPVGQMLCRFVLVGRLRYTSLADAAISIESSHARQLIVGFGRVIPGRSVLEPVSRMIHPLRRKKNPQHRP